MANIGDRFQTGNKNPTSGFFAFDRYLDGSTSPAPTEAERVIPLSAGETFPPLKSSQKACYWKLLRFA